MALAERLYLASFPECERRPWAKIRDAAPHSYPALWGIYLTETSAAEFVGLITLWRFERFTYVEHFAVMERLRGRGIGSEVIKQIAAEGPVVLEVEPATVSKQASRRIAFYERAALSVISRTYRQPPYAPGLPWVDLWLMGSHGCPQADEVTELLHKRVYACISPPLGPV